MVSVTLHKAKRILSSEGPFALGRRGLELGLGICVAYFGMLFGSASRSVAGDAEQTFDYVSRVGGGVIRPIQVRSEIIDLLRRVGDLRPKVVVEIGTAAGGNLFLFSRMADPHAHIISVDLPGGEFGEGYPIWKVPLYRSLALPGQRIDLIRGNSHAPEILERVRGLLGNDGAIDFLFIDADHTYGGVKKDFEMYGSLVRRGGLIAFHDIATHLAGYGVDQLWSELRARSNTEEFIEPGEHGWGGIGLLRA